MFDESLSSPEATTSADTLKEIKEKVDRVYALKLKSAKAEKEFKDAKNELAKLLEDSKVDKMQGDDCTVSLLQKSSVQFPKDEAGKKKAFDYIRKEFGETVLQEMLTVNANSFNSFYNAEVERKAAEGDYEPDIAGLKPFTYFSLGIRKRAKKK